MAACFTNTCISNTVAHVDIRLTAVVKQLNAREVTYLVFTLHPEPSDGVKRLVTLLRLTRTPSLTPIVEMLLPVFDCDTVNVSVYGQLLG